MQVRHRRVDSPARGAVFCLVCGAGGPSRSGARDARSGVRHDRRRVQSQRLMTSSRGAGAPARAPAAPRRPMASQDPGAVGRQCHDAVVELRCRTRNLARWASGQQWVDEVAGSSDIIFLQEVPAPAGLRVPDGFAGFPGSLQPLRDRGHCRSLTLVADHLVPHVRDEGFVLPELLMDYVSESVLQLPGTDPIHLLNVHASPRPVTFDATPYEAWRRPSEGRVYYADVISRELGIRVAAGKRVVAVETSTRRTTGTPPTAPGPVTSSSRDWSRSACWTRPVGHGPQMSRPRRSTRTKSTGSSRLRR